MTKAKHTRKKALDLFRVLKRHFDEGISIPKLAIETGRSERTLYCDIRIFREQGIKGFSRQIRADKGRRRKITPEVVKAIEGLCLEPPKPPITWVYRQIAESCERRGIAAPSYWVVLDVYHRLDERLKTLAHEGPKAYDQRFEELLRREAEHPNDMWQCDHKDLKLWAVDHSGRVGKVWLTAILDDFSRMVPGYYLAIGAPNSMRIAIALRQGIWAKEDDRWPVSGIPDIFYSDHGRDFESTHIEQVAADLGMELVNTIEYKPRGRGKIERFFRTLVQMFCRNHKTSRDQPKPLAEIDTAFSEWLEKYHHRKHTEIKMTPFEKWTGGGLLPRLPASLEDLDLMLMKVAQPRTMHRDGLRLDNRRYSHELLTESIGEEFDIRYDPRDLEHIWVYGLGGGNLICKADFMGLHPSREQIAETIARRQRVKKRLNKDLNDKKEAGEAFVSKPALSAALPRQTNEQQQPKRRLRKHFHERT